MKFFTDLKKNNKVGLIVALVFVLLGIVGCVAGLVKGLISHQPVNMVHICVNLLMYFLVSAYALWGYRKPHGNMLKYTAVFFGILIIAQSILSGSPLISGTVRDIICACSAIAAMAVAYIAGRLDRIGKNKYLMIFVGLLVTVCSVLLICSFADFNFMRCLSNLTQPICWSALCLAYISRYDEHKSAGAKNMADGKR